MSASAGRPRDPSVDPKVIEAALDTINEVGLVGLSVDGIAARAGVSKATIYRRWHSKDELVVDAIVTLAQSLRLPETGDVRTDLVAVVTELRGFVCDTVAGEILPWLAGEVAGQTDLGARYSSAVIAPKRALVAEIITRAVEREDLRPDIDIEIAVDTVVGTVIARRLSGGFEDTSPSWAEDFVDALLRGWAL